MSVICFAAFHVIARLGPASALPRRRLIQGFGSFDSAFGSFLEDIRDDKVGEDDAAVIFVHRSDIVVIGVFAAIAYTISYYKQKCRCAPYLNKVAPTVLDPASGAVLASILYASNIAYNVLNKRVLMVHPYPLLLTTVNLGACSVCCILAWVSGFQAMPTKLPSLMRLLPLAAMHWVSIYAANVSVSQVNLALTHTVKAGEPLITALLSCLLLGIRPTPRDLVGLVMIAAGVVLASITDVSSASLGITMAMASNFGVSFRHVLSKKLLKSSFAPQAASSEAQGQSGGDSDPLNLAALLHLGAFAMSAPFALALESHHLHNFTAAPWQSLLIPLIGVLVWVFNMVSFTLLSRSTPITHSVIRSLRRPVLIMSSIAAFGTHVHPWNAVGILVALLGAWLCTGL